MNITVYITTKKILPYINSGLKEYIKRLSRFTKVKIKKVKRIKSVDSKTYNIKISKLGKLISSKNLAKEISTIAQSGISDINFYLTNDAIEADKTIAISKMDLDNQMKLIILVEQIYRAFSINNNMPYHK
jgi:23S rRNA (pseudouridine1915-N3)-methyltransferase